MSAIPSYQTEELMHNGRPLWSQEMPRPPVRPAYRTDEYGRCTDLYTYSATEVANKIQRFVASPPNFTRRNAIQEFVARVTRTENPEEVANLYAYLQLFDQMYFFGALTDRPLCYIEMVSIVDWGLWGDCTTHRNDEFGEIDRRFECRIRILDVSQRPEFGDNRVRMRHYIQVVLHEATHAIFGLYVARSSEPSEPEEHDAIYNLDCMGHGRAWQDVALLVENHISSLGRDGFDLGRLLSFWNSTDDFRASASDMELERWGFGHLVEL